MQVVFISGLSRIGVEDWETAPKETILDHSQPLPPGNTLLQYWSPPDIEPDTYPILSSTPSPSCKHKEKKRHVYKDGLKALVQEVMITGFLSP